VPSSWSERLREFRARHAKLLAVAAFLGGFLFDVMTLGRIDSGLTIAQQGVVLAVLGAILGCELLAAEGVVVFESPRARKLWEFRLVATQFLFGGLMSAYAIFYFKSASVLGALVFIPLLGFLMVLVESARFRRGAGWLRVGVYALCLSSYFAYVVPTLWGSLGVFPFVLAMLLTALLLWALHRVARWRGLSAAGARKGILLPGGAVIAAFTGLYFLALIPPVPLSLQYAGIYHGVEKEAGGYRLLHERAWWRVWERGDQYFRARPGDQIYLFARIFAPRAFRDEVRVRWLKHDARRGWVTWDVIPITILGGREQGFRGYAFKSNYEPGLWRVQLETVEGREIGRIRFHVVPDSSTGERALAVERM
jgi:hypothetical protein